jgi:hypothetical protein
MLFAFGDSPRDIERRFRTTRAGSVRQGTLTREQTFAGAHTPSAAGVAPPSMACTSAAGASTRGSRAASAAATTRHGSCARDLGLERWWPDPSSTRARSASSQRSASA